MLEGEKGKEFKVNGLVFFRHNGTWLVAKIKEINPVDANIASNVKGLTILEVVFANGETARILPTDETHTITREELEVAAENAGDLSEEQ